jgi:DNA-directed RNA polymerase subunit M/transcription elongation factor TFIIS
MDTIDQAAEWRRLEELYRSRNDGELEAIAADANHLTELARDVLQRELSSRGLKLEPVAEVPTADPEPKGDLAYDPGQMDLEVGAIVWSREEALRVKQALDYAGVPPFFGPDLAPEIDDFHGDWSSGVEVRIEADLQQRAVAALRLAAREEGPESKQESESIPDSGLRCPKCHSDGIIFEELEKDSPKQPDFQSKFQWRCDDCGYQWTDDGHPEVSQEL